MVEELVDRLQLGVVVHRGGLREQRLQQAHRGHGPRPDTLRGLRHAVGVPCQRRQQREQQRCKGDETADQGGELGRGAWAGPSILRQRSARLESHCTLATALL